MTHYNIMDGDGAPVTDAAGRVIRVQALGDVSLCMAARPGSWYQCRNLDTGETLTAANTSLRPVKHDTPNED